MLLARRSLRPGRIVLVTALSLCISTVPMFYSETAWGQTSIDTSIAPGDSVTLNFQDADIRALITTVSQITGKNFVVDPRVKGKVTLVSGDKLSADQIYNIFLSVLEVHNFAAVPAGQVIKILPSNVVKQRPTPTAFTAVESPGDQQITQVYQLKFSSVQELVPILRPLLPPTSHFAPHAPTNTLVFTDTAANVQRIVKIIERIDQPDRRSDVHVVYLRYAKAQELAPILSQLTTSLRPQTGEGGTPATQQLSVQAEATTNSLIIQAPEAEFQLLQAVIDQLDIERPVEGDFHVVYLRHAKAANLVDLLNEVLETAAGGEEGQAIPRALSVRAEEDTNALVIRAPDEEFQALKNVIDKIDIRRAQIFVETIIVEIRADKAADLGVEWEFSDNGTTSGEVAGNTDFSDISGGLTVGVIDKLVENIFGEQVPNFRLIVRALKADANANILATPNILTLDNEAAEIIVAQEIPFITGQFVSDVSTGAVIEGGDDGAIATGIVNPFQTIERKDVGLTLRITPQINEGDTVQLEIEQEVSNVSPTTVEGASDIITNKRSLSATVQVDDGQVIVLGGLIRDDVFDTVEWVPILGKIPIIGALFRRKSKEAAKSNLMIFLRPKIVRSAQDIAGLTQQRYEHVQEESRQSQPDTPNMIEGVTLPVPPDIDWDAQYGDRR